MDYKSKYLKYKKKYLELKKIQSGGERKSPTQSATLFKVGTKKKGNDGNTWIVVINKNRVKRWKLHKKKYIDMSKLHAIDLFDVQIVKPNQIKKYIDESRKLRILKNIILPELIKNGVKVFFIPLPISSKGIYWVDYAKHYIDKFYNSKLDKNYLIVTIYLTSDLKINYEREIKIEFSLQRLELLEKMDNKLKEYLPYDYEVDHDLIWIKH